MLPPYESRNSTLRSIFRGASLILLPTGAVFAVIGFVDFFGAFSGHGFPTKFWCAFVGLPLLGLGTFCFKAGFLRTMTGYVAGEAAPAVRDTVEYVAEGLKPTIRSLAEETMPSETDPAVRMRRLEALKREG